MKSNKITLPKREMSKYDSRNNLIRVDFDVLDQLEVLCYQTAMTKKEILSILLRDALSRVELVERKVYGIRCNDQEEEESEQ